MHLDVDERHRAMSLLAQKLASGQDHVATLIIRSRHGKVPEGRRMFDVSIEETVALGEANGLIVVDAFKSESLQPENRAKGIQWSNVILGRSSSRTG